MSYPSQPAVLRDVTRNLAATAGLHVCAVCVSNTVSPMTTLRCLHTPFMSDNSQHINQNVLLHRSALRQDKRAEALKECIKMISAPGGGCCTVFPFEAAIWLLEEQEELFGNGNGSNRVQRSSTMSCTNLHRLVSKGSRSNLLIRGPSKTNLYQQPSLSGTNSSLQSMGGLQSTNNLQGLGMGSLTSTNNLQSMGQQTPSPQQLNWYRGDSIRGVDREFIYKVHTLPPLLMLLLLLHSCQIEWCATP